MNLSNEHGVEILAKDLELFKYPCHFSAFRANQKVDGQDIGKAFMMQYEWQGVLYATMKKILSFLSMHGCTINRGKVLRKTVCQKVFGQ